MTLRARWVTLRARWATLRARWVTLRARWVTLRARWVTLRYAFISREFNKEDEQPFAVSHPERFASAAMTMLDAPEERMTRQFKYDSLADAQVRHRAARLVSPVGACVTPALHALPSSTHDGGDRRGFIPHGVCEGGTHDGGVRG